MMYNLSTPLDRERFAARANALLRKGSVVELREKNLRSRQQNSYLHLILGVVAMETGVTLEYCKEQYFKRLVNPDIFVRTIADKYLGEMQVIRSSAELTTEETNIAIERFRRWCSEEGFYLPSPEDESRLRDIEIEMGRLNHYL